MNSERRGVACFESENILEIYHSLWLFFLKKQVQLECFSFHLMHAIY